MALVTSCNEGEDHEISGPQESYDINLSVRYIGPIRLLVKITSRRQTATRLQIILDYDEQQG